MKRLLPLLVLLVAATARAEEPLPGTLLLDSQLPSEDRSAAMVAGISTWLHGEADRQTKARHERWEAAAKGAEWEKFAAGKRAELTKVLGFEAKRSVPMLEQIQGDRVRWTVFDGVYGEGIIYAGEKETRELFGTWIVVPDADEAPESCLIARRLAACGIPVIVPVLVDRRSDFAGKEDMRMTNQSHREWIYRQSFEMGRTLVGYEVQKVLALADALDGGISLAGSGEGGGVALRAAALDKRFRHVLLSGYFEPHAAYEKEPIDRNLFGAWREFGDAELASLVSGILLVEYGTTPVVQGTPPLVGNVGQAAPGTLTPPSKEAVRSEMAQRISMQEALVTKSWKTCWPSCSGRSRTLPWAERACRRRSPKGPQLPNSSGSGNAELCSSWSSLPRDSFRKPSGSAVPTSGRRSARRRGSPRAPLCRSGSGLRSANSRPTGCRRMCGTRRILDAPKWTAYEVMLDVLPEVFAWGYLLVPKDIQPGERRPVVVCQHGLEGLPGDCVTQDPKDKAFGFYKGFAAQLADLGYLTYAPHNPYRGKDAFRTLQRQANPLGLSLFSFIVAQHEVTTAWLAGLPFVDAQRIGFYGLSYGGKTAMRVPALVDRYALSICSGDFNEWIRKNASVEERPSYMWTGEYEIFEWNLAWNANYAEMAMLIAPRPFMVERGHQDGVATDEWVGYEFAKVRHGYQRLAVPERATIEWFDGPHTINGKGTFEFLREHLGPVKR